MTLGEVFTKALADTLMGMGTVFIILIVICLIISLFKFIPKDKPKKTIRAASEEVGRKSFEPVTEAASEGLTEEEDEDEIIAVILAAIRMAMAKEAAVSYAAEGEMTADQPQYVVRSIRRRR